MRRLMNLPTWRRKKGKLSQCGCMVGFWYSAANVKSEQSHRVKALLGSRDQLVRAKRALGNQFGECCGRSASVCCHGKERRSFLRRPIRQCGTIAMFNANATALLESAGGNRGSDCALGSATQGVGATLGRNFRGNPKFWDSGLSSTRRPPTTHENDTHRAIHVKRPLSFSIGQVEERNCAVG
jgi:hypothetical protein